MKVTNIEQKTNPEKGTQFKALTLEGEGKPVNIFSFHSMYDSIQEGDEVELEMNGAWKNVVDPQKPQSGGGGTGSGKFALAQTVKNEAIKTAMTNKEESIKISSTARDATLIAIHLGSKLDVSVNDFKEAWTEWRTWLLKNWDVDEPFH